MEKYVELKDLLRLLMYALDMDIAGYQSFFQRRLATDYKDNAQEFLSTIRSQVEKAITDPDFDWFEIGAETGFVEACDDDPTWPFKTSADVIYYFQLLTFDILYPERALSLAEQELLRRTVLYLLLDIIEEKGRIWVSSEVLLGQLHSMTPLWAQLEDYHLYCLHDYFFELKGGYSLRIKHLRLCERDHRPYLDVLRQCIDAGYTPYCHIPYYKWPPFEINGKTDESMTYFKSEWLKVVDAKIKQ
jgi:hypothetical protein